MEGFSSTAAFQNLSEDTFKVLLDTITSRVNKMKDLPDESELKSLVMKDLEVVGRELGSFDIPLGHVLIIKAIQDHIQSNSKTKEGTTNERVIEMKSKDVEVKFLELANKYIHGMTNPKVRDVQAQENDNKWSISCPFCDINVLVAVEGTKCVGRRFKQHITTHKAIDDATIHISDDSQSTISTEESTNESVSSQPEASPPKKRAVESSADLPLAGTSAGKSAGNKRSSTIKPTNVRSTRTVSYFF